MKKLILCSFIISMQLFGEPTEAITEGFSQNQSVERDSDLFPKAWLEPFFNATLLDFGAVVIAIGYALSHPSAATIVLQNVAIGGGFVLGLWLRSLGKECAAT